MTLTPSDQRILRVLDCVHAHCVTNPALPPGLLECLDCGGIAGSPKPPPRKRKRKRKRA